MKRQPEVRPGQDPKSAGPPEGTVASLNKETWEYIELKLWSSFRNRLWTIVTAILAVVSALGYFGVRKWIRDDVSAALQEELRASRKRAAQAVLHNYLVSLFVLHDRGYVEMLDYFGKVVPESLQARVLGGGPSFRLVRRLSGRPLFDYEPFALEGLSSEIRRMGRTLDSLGINRDVVQMWLVRLGLANNHLYALRTTAEYLRLDQYPPPESDLWSDLRAEYEQEIYPLYKARLDSASHGHTGQPLTWKTGPFEIHTLSAEAGQELGTVPARK